MGGGAGSGKSWLICESRIINAIAFPGYKSFIARDQLTRLMASTYQTFIKLHLITDFLKDMIGHLMGSIIIFSLQMVQGLTS